LTEAGSVHQERAVRDSRSRLWLSLTPAGKRACIARVRALREIVGTTDG
jgi:hypothetical protein